VNFKLSTRNSNQDIRDAGLHDQSHLVPWKVYYRIYRDVISLRQLLERKVSLFKV